MRNIPYLAENCRIRGSYFKRVFVSFIGTGYIYSEQQILSIKGVLRLTLSKADAQDYLDRFRFCIGDAYQKAIDYAYRDFCRTFCVCQSNS